MTDATERRLWFDAYFGAAMEHVPAPVSKSKARKIRAWAQSMAAIAEQFVGNDGDELEMAE